MLLQRPAVGILPRGVRAPRQAGRAAPHGGRPPPLRGHRGPVAGQAAARRLRVPRGSDNGVVTTRPFELKGEEVFINADARWGEIYTEILDAESGRPIPGFWVPGERPPPFTGDSTRARVA